MKHPDATSPHVTVVVATYRCDGFLHKAIESILQQTYRNFEVLIADDGADIRTRKTVEAFADNRLKYLSNPTRLGPAQNHWNAFAQAKGEFLTILNHDDIWKPAFLERVLLGFRDERVVVSFSDHDVIDESGLVIAGETARLSRQTGRDTLPAGLHIPFVDIAVQCGIPAAQSALFRKDALVIEKLPKIAGPAYDFWLNYLLAKGGRAAFYTPERLASWRQHSVSLSFVPTLADWPAGSAACWEALAEDPLFAHWSEVATSRASEHYSAASLASLRGGETRRSLEFAKLAMRRKMTIKAFVISIIALLPPIFAKPLLGTVFGTP